MKKIIGQIALNKYLYKINLPEFSETRVLLTPFNGNTVYGTLENSSLY